MTSVPEGIVLLSDSMLTLASADGQMVTTFENAEKLIELGTASLPAATMISGSGDVNGKLVSALLRRASEILTFFNPSTHEEVVSAVRTEIDREYSELIPNLREQAADANSQLNVLGNINEDRESRGLPALERVESIHVAIQGAIDNSPEAFILIQAPSVTVVVASFFEDRPAATAITWPGPSLQETAHPGVSWWGSGGTAIGRLMLGFDLPALGRRAAEEERTSRDGLPPGVAATLPHEDPEIARKVVEYVRRIQPEMAIPVPIHAMPLQDAIEFTEFLGKVACGYDKFSVGPAAVGGPLDVLVLQPGRRSWMRRKTIHSSQ